MNDKPNVRPKKRIEAFGQRVCVFTMIICLMVIVIELSFGIQSKESSLKKEKDSYNELEEEKRERFSIFPIPRDFASPNKNVSDNEMIQNDTTSTNGDKFLQLSKDFRIDYENKILFLTKRKEEINLPIDSIVQIKYELRYVTFYTCNNFYTVSITFDKIKKHLIFIPFSPFILTNERNTAINKFYATDWECYKKWHYGNSNSKGLRVVVPWMADRDTIEVAEPKLKEVKSALEERGKYYTCKCKNSRKSQLVVSYEKDDYIRQLEEEVERLNQLLVKRNMEIALQNDFLRQKNLIAGNP